MFTLRDSTIIHAPIERCFALSTHLAIVERELGMHPVAGRTSGCVQGGDTVHWKGWQLGFPNFHVSLISQFERPYYFQDRMLAGRFRSFQHDHRFRQLADGVGLDDEVRFTLPFGWPGRVVGRLCVTESFGLLRLSATPCTGCVLAGTLPSQGDVGPCAEVR